jgi:hypothetical protein
LPSNAHIYLSVQEALQDAPWDWVLTHNVNDLMDVREIRIPKAFLVHGTLSGRILQDRSAIDPSLYVQNLQFLLAADNCQVVYISELKRKDWGIPGEVIRPGIDIREYGGYQGNIRGILQVCNHLKERSPITGWETHQEVCRDLSHCVLGNNKTLLLGRIANSWDDLKEQLRSYRVYLYTPVYPYEDGYNLALLEAMATGMPIATLRHATSPIRDGSEGVSASTALELREKIIGLLDNPIEASRLGKGARIRVEKEFPISAFQRAWQSFAAQLIRMDQNR